MGKRIDVLLSLKDDFSANLEKAKKNFGTLDKQLNETGKRFWKSGNSMIRTGSTLTKALTLPIVGIGAAAIKVGIDFEESMSQVKAVTGASVSEMEQLEKAARDAGAKTSKSASEAADALGYMGLAGWDVQQSIEGLMPVLRLSEAGQMDLARASDLVTDSMSAMGIEIKDLPHYLDVVAQAARSSNTNIDQLMEAYLGVGGVLRGLNIPIEESAVALGMLANAGIKGSEGGKSLSSILTNLTAPTGRAQKALEELGFTAFDTEGNFKGMDKTLFELKGKLEGLTQEEKNNYLSMIAGKEHVKGLNALINGLDDSYDKLTDSIGDADGALNDMADTMLDNNKGSIAELKSELEELGLKIYDTLRPAIADVTEIIKKFIGKLNELTPEQQETISKFIILAGSIGPVILAVGKLTKGIGKFYFKMGDIAKLFRKGTGIKGMIGPGFKILAVAMLIAGAAYLIYQNWDKISGIVEKLSEGFEALKEKADNLKEKWEEFTSRAADPRVVEAMERLKEVFAQIKGWVEPVVDYFTETLLPKIQDVFGKIGDALSDLWDFVAPILKDFFIATLEELATAFEFLTPVIEFVGGILADTVSYMLDNLGEIIDFVRNVFTGNWEGAWENVKNIFDNKIELVKNIWNRIKDLLSKILKPKIDVIYDAFKRGVDKAREMWKNLKEFLRHPIRGTVNLFRGGNADIGQNARGTNYWRGGKTIVGEEGPELVDLPKGSKIYSNPKTINMLSGNTNAKPNQTNNINITFGDVHVKNQEDANKLADIVAQKINNSLKNTVPNPV